MNRFWRHLSYSVMALAVLSSSASSWAAEKMADVKVRGGDHSDYTRIVFEWKNAPRYHVSKTETSLTLKFDEPALLNVEGSPIETLSRINGYKIIDEQSIELDFSQGLGVRHFTIGNRIIVDLKGNEPEKKPEKKEANNQDKKSEPVNLAKKITERPKEIIEEIIAKTKETPQIKIDTIIDEKKEEKADQAQKQEEEKKLIPHQINIAGTTSFALAAFEKGNKIWIVYDRPDVIVPPQIEGPDREKMGAFKRIPLNDISVFTIDRPARYKLHAKGGGLVWKIDMDNHASEYSPNPLTNHYDEQSEYSPSLLFPAKSFHRAVDFIDPETGEKLLVAVVNSAQDFSGKSQKFSQLDTLPSIVGAAIVSKIDDLSIKKTEEGAEIFRPNGLALSHQKDRPLFSQPSKEEETGIAESNQNFSKIFDFKQWHIGSPESLIDNQRLTLSGLLEKNDQKKTENLLTLGRMMLSYGFAPEAVGYFDLAEQYTPELRKNPEFQALRGASEVMSGNVKNGFANLSYTTLDDVDEIKLWRAYALSELDDWQQAAKILPHDVTILEQYPSEVLAPIGLRLAEVALREGNTRKANDILDIIKKSQKEKAPLAYIAARTYLEGELYRQKGDIEKAKELWSSLETGKDDLYRAKARLAMATLRHDKKEITLDKAIDTLEGLRYAWRGDELETAVSFNLGKFYLEKGEPIRALGLMRQASSLIPNSEQGKMISQIMHATFTELYMTDKIQSLSPLEALTLYDEFAELIPAGAEGDRLARQLAERLVDVDLLPRAINLLKQQVDKKLSGLEGATVAIRLASLEVMDSKPKNALETLDKAEKFLAGIPAEEADPKRRSIAMLRAKAFSQLGKTQDSFAALSLLSQEEDIVRLRADIAWKNKKWQEAADALEQIISKEDISRTRPLTEEQAKLILDWSVALYLADNRYVLANLRERYSDSMAQTSRAKEFDVVTRPRQNILLADRETIRNIIGETEIFKDFMDSFKEDLTGPLPKKTRQDSLSGKQSPSPKSVQKSANIPQSLKDAPLLQTDEVLAD